MHVPIPNDKLVAFTLAGAVLTAIVAGALAVPIDGVTRTDDRPDASKATGSNGPEVGGDAPTPNQDFTPAVQTRPGFGNEEEYGDDEHDEDEHDEDEHGEDEEDDDDDEYDD